MSYDAAMSPVALGLQKNVLVVEDDIGLRFLLSEWLRLCGYKVYEAVNADEAIIILSSPILIDVLITDVDMPGSMNGLELVEYIKSKISGINILVVSGKHPDHQAIDKDIQFFQKPYSLEAIKLHLIKVLGGKDAE